LLHVFRAKKNHQQLQENQTIQFDAAETVEDSSGSVLFETCMKAYARFSRGAGFGMLGLQALSWGSFVFHGGDLRTTAGEEAGLAKSIRTKYQGSSTSVLVDHWHLIYVNCEMRALELLKTAPN
jgi:hypothetical protein